MSSSRSSGEGQQDNACNTTSCKPTDIIPSIMGRSVRLADERYGKSCHTELQFRDSSTGFNPQRTQLIVSVFGDDLAGVSQSFLSGHRSLSCYTYGLHLIN